MPRHSHSHGFRYDNMKTAVEAIFIGKARQYDRRFLRTHSPVLTNGKVSGDKVGPHGDLLSEFPYLGPPHNA